MVQDLRARRSTPARGDEPARARHQRKAPAFRVQGRRHHPPTATTPSWTSCATCANRGRRSSWPTWRQREREQHRHQEPEGRLQPRVRLLHRGHEVVLRPGAHDALRPQADAGQLPSASSPRSSRSWKRRSLARRITRPRLEYQLFLRAFASILSAHIAAQLARMAHALKDAGRAPVARASARRITAMCALPSTRRACTRSQNGRHPVVEQAIGCGQLRAQRHAHEPRGTA